MGCYAFAASCTRGGTQSADILLEGGVKLTVKFCDSTQGGTEVKRMLCHSDFL